MLERLLVALDKLAPDLVMVVLASGAMVRKCEMRGCLADQMNFSRMESILLVVYSRLHSRNPWF